MPRKILLRQIDGKMPNLVLMKISAYHKEKGDIVDFNIQDPDIVYSSIIFDWNQHKLRNLHEFEGIPHLVGGSGISLETELPYQIEHIMPDYSLYGIDYSMGFTSRGCPRKCPFCIVPQKEGGIREHALLGEFLDPDHRKVILVSLCI